MECSCTHCGNILEMTVGKSLRWKAKKPISLGDIPVGYVWLHNGTEDCTQSPDGVHDRDWLQQIRTNWPR